MGLFDVLNINRKQPEKVDFKRYIVPQQNYRTRQDIQKFREAVLTAENVHLPNRRQLYKGYQDAWDDAHVKAVINNRKLKTLGKDFAICNEEGEEIEDITVLFKSEWFRQFIDYALDSIYWGHSLIELGDIIDDQFKEVTLVKRENVRPEFHTVTKNSSDIPTDGIKYDEGIYKNWNIGVGLDHDLGLLKSIMPLWIYKKESLGGWSQYTEIFGQPMRVGKTNTTNEPDREHMEEQLQNMGSSAYAVIGQDDEFQFLFPNDGAAFKSYEDLCRFCDEQISKIVFGQTMTSDNGSSRSQSEVHERLAEDYVRADSIMIENLVNQELIPRMRNLGITIPECYFKFDSKERVTANEQFERVKELIKSYDVDPEYIEKEFNIPVTPKQQSTIGGSAEGKYLTL